MFLRNPTLLVALCVLSTGFAGCMGGKTESNGIPTAFFTVTPQDGVTFLFDATNSSDPDGQDLEVEWNFGDEGEQFGPLNEYGLIEYTYAVTDTTFMVSLVVRDPEGHSSAMMEIVTLGTGTNAAPDVALKNTTRWVKPDGGVVIDASRSADPNGDLFSYEWYIGPYDGKDPLIQSGLLNESQSYSQTFDKAGTWLISCHPHPWMKSRIIVSDTDPNATSSAEVEIRNFAYHDKVVTISPGGSVKWINVDPVEHTATSEWFAPGNLTSTSPILSAKLPAGDYQAHIVVNDGKGGLNHQALGLKASDDAPANPRVEHLNKTEVNNVEPASPAEQYIDDFVLEWPANVTGSVSWSDPAGQYSWKIQLAKDGQVLADCFMEEATCTFVRNLEPGTYQIIQTISGFAVQGSNAATVTAIQYTKPDFGDSGNVCPPPRHFHAGQCH